MTIALMQGPHGGDISPSSYQFSDPSKISGTGKGADSFSIGCEVVNGRIHLVGLGTRCR